MPIDRKAWYLLYYPAFAILLIWLAFTGKQSQFSELVVLWCLCYLFYGLIICNKDAVGHSLLWWLIPLLIKLALIFTPPELSNDFVRFWWDGFLSKNGISPYYFTPHEILLNYSNTPFAEQLQTHFDKLNSKEYHTVYPPLSQFLFYCSASISGGQLSVFSGFLKFFYLLADVLTLLLVLKILRQLSMPNQWAFLYFANPLCIIELQGNLHTEQFMILFLASAIYFSIRNNIGHVCWSLICSVLSKLNAFLLFPLFVHRKSGLIHYGILALSFTVIAIAIYLPVSMSSSGFEHSIGLYFQKFEFNSLFYAYIRDWLFDHKYYELKTKLGWILLFCFTIGAAIIFMIQFFKRTQSTFSFASAWWMIALFLFLSSTVHPWYICPLIFLGLFYLPLSSILWSFVIFFSYSHYDPQYEAYYRPLTGISYLVVFISVYLEQNGKIKIPFRML